MNIPDFFGFNQFKWVVLGVTALLMSCHVIDLGNAVTESWVTPICYVCLIASLLGE